MRRRYSDEQKHKILMDLKQSGLNRAAYCRREGLCYQSVSKWVSRSKIGVQTTSLALVEVKNNSVDPVPEIVVRMGGSLEVGFSPAVSMQQLALFCREVQRC